MIPVSSATSLTLVCSACAYPSHEKKMRSYKGNLFLCNFEKTYLAHPINLMM